MTLCQFVQRICVIGDSLHPNGPDSEAQIAPEDDKTHEHYEQQVEKLSQEDVTDVGSDDTLKTNGKTNKNNTSV